MTARTNLIIPQRPQYAPDPDFDNVPLTERSYQESERHHPTLNSCDLTKKILKATFSGLVATTCLGVQFFTTLSDPIYALVMGGFGMAGQYFIQQITPIVNFEENILGNYSAPIFLTLTQIILNIPPNETAGKIVNGMLFSLFGMQTAYLIDSLFHLTINDDRTTESYDREKRIYHIHLLNGNTGNQRRIQDFAKVIFAAGLLGYGYMHEAWGALAKLAWIVLGHAIGGALYELAHTYRLYIEQKHPIDLEASSILHPVVNRIRLFEKISHLVAITLPAYFLALSYSLPHFPVTDVLAGACFGITRTIHMIRFTTLSGSEIDEIQKLTEEEIEARPTSQKIVEFLFNKAHFWHVSVIGFALWQGYIGTYYDRIVMGSLAGSFLLSYLAGRLVNLAEIDDETPSIVSTLFFYLHYSQTPPLLFSAINQWIAIGDEALSTYNTAYLVFDSLAWASLGSSLGTQASEQAAGRRRPYPARVNPTGLLLAGVYWVREITKTLNLPNGG